MELQVQQYLQSIQDRALFTGLASLMVADILIDAAYTSNGVEFFLTDGFEAVTTPSFTDACKMLAHALTH